MFITKLQVYNACLQTTGELPLNTVDTDHPLIPPAVNALDVALVREQAKSWWFNREQVTLTPDATTKNIFIPDDTLSIDPVDQTEQYVQRGNRLYNRYAAPSLDPWEFSAPVVCWLVRLVDWDDLPASVQTYIRACTVLDFQLEYDADPNKTARLQRLKDEAYLQLNAEHIRNTGANLLNNPSVANRIAAFRRYPRWW